MKPKTKNQIRVVELSSKLNSVTNKQKEWAYNYCLEKFAVFSRKTMFCLECGYSWKDNSFNEVDVLECKCKNCQSTLKLAKSYRRILKDSAYFGILTTKEEFQVVRIFYVSKWMKKNQKPDFLINEVLQHWIDNKGEVVTMSKSVQGLSYYFDQWIFQSELEVRPKSFQTCERYNINPYKIYPVKKILPILKRNGFTNNFHGFAPHQLFSLILQNSCAETLLKCNQIALLEYNNFDRIKENWSSIKVCIRNNYFVKEPSLWFDYLRLLRHFRRDLNNAKYVCPNNLIADHDHLVIKKREQDRRLKLLELRTRIEIDQLEYEKQKGAFFNIQFGDGEILIKTLGTVEEFMNEGDTLNHCVFTNEYYKKENSLILSARIENQPIETIEVSLPELKIVQSRGFGNRATEYHDKILDLVNRNIRNFVKSKTA